MNERQLGRLKRLADWLHEHDRKFLFELLVPATDAQLASVGGDTDRYDAELRPELMRRAIEDDPGLRHRGRRLEDRGRRRAQRRRRCSPSRPAPARAARTSTCVLLGRGASTEKVEQWLEQAAPVDGFIGFAIGRSIWWDALKGFLGKELEREAAASQIADNYLHFVQVYEGEKVA